MLSSIKYKLSSVLKKDNERSSKILKNIIISFGVKGGSILISLLLIPMTIDYINPVQYGIWLTISSIISWMAFFDIGLGNGLRNSLANALALNRYDEAKIFVSTTYAVLTIISTFLFILFFFINPFLDWRSFLNIPTSVVDNINSVVFIVLCSFCLQFVAQLINTVLTAVHEPALAAVVSFIGQLGVLIAIFILKHTVPGSLGILVLTLTAIPIIVLIGSSLYFYTSKLKHIAPALSKVDFKYAKSILNIGGAFFIIQIGALVLFQTNNIIITKVIGPEAVTDFNIVYKLFSVIIMLFNIVMTPYWSAFTDAYARSDFSWMKSTIKKIRKVWIITCVIPIPVICLIAPYIFHFWVGDKVHISTYLTYFMGLYVIGYTGMMLNCFFLNGIGKLRIQLLLYIVVAIINVPLSIYFASHFGTEGVALSNVFIFAVMCVILWIQSDKIINQKAKGIWAA